MRGEKRPRRRFRRNGGLSQRQRKSIGQSGISRDARPARRAGFGKGAGLGVESGEGLLKLVRVGTRQRIKRQARQTGRRRAAVWPKARAGCHGAMRNFEIWRRNPRSRRNSAGAALGRRLVAFRRDQPPVGVARCDITGKGPHVDRVGHLALHVVDRRSRLVLGDIDQL